MFNGQNSLPDGASSSHPFFFNASAKIVKTYMLNQGSKSQFVHMLNC